MNPITHRDINPNPQLDVRQSKKRGGGAGSTDMVSKNKISGRGASNVPLTDIRNFDVMKQQQYDLSPSP